MKGKRIFLTAALGFAVGAAGVAAANVFHFALSSSAPAADATVPALEEVRLVFTEAPQAGSVGIRLVDASGAAVATTEPTVDPENAMTVSVKPNSQLATGRYTVRWRGIGDDGHVVSGDFDFAVNAQ